MTATTEHPPVDLVHLARQTGGNEALGREVLRMVLEGTADDLARLRQAAGKERREVAHLILGSARAIGAGAVAEAAAAVEAGDENLSNLEAALGAANQFIAGYLSL
jgi:HPt (histidine-containing phosphotransfer) domain-containing protein